MPSTETAQQWRSRLWLLAALDELIAKDLAGTLPPVTARG